MNGLFKRQTLDQLCDVPDDIIDVYVVERHIWQGGTIEGEADSKRKRCAELRTVKDFLIDPVRPLLNDVLRQLAAPYCRAVLNHETAFESFQSLADCT